MDGEYVELASLADGEFCSPSNAQIHMVLDRVGNYQIVVTQVDDKMWASCDVAVIAGACHVILNKVDVLLDTL